MNKDEFAALWRRALEQAASNADTALGFQVPRALTIRLRGAGPAEDELSPEAALERLYLGPDRFYRIVDVSVTEVTPERSIVFVRVSAHAPATFEKTWNEPRGMGPFKQLIAKAIKVTRRQGH